jgi:hypothetical protein
MQSSKGRRFTLRRQGSHAAQGIGLDLDSGSSQSLRNSGNGATRGRLDDRTPDYSPGGAALPLLRG